MDLHTIIEGLDYLSQSANKSAVMMNNVIVLCIELGVIFAIRFVYLLKINEIPIRNAKPEESKTRILIQNHLGFEFCLAILVSWLMMIVVSSVELNYVVNLIISPIVGTLTGITLDEIYILPRKQNSLYTVSQSGKKTKSEDSITININNADDELKFHDAVLELLPESLAESEDFNLKVIQSINNVTQVIADLRESEMIERKMELKSEMYRCLSNGFATPAEHDKIRALYHSYVNLLKGNGDVKNLYDNHFSHLGVHEDRRKGQTSYQGPDRRINNNCEYGQFDNEIQEKEECTTLNIDE